MATKLEILYQQKLNEDHRKVLKRRLSKKSAKVLFDSLKSAAAEKDIENAWRKIFTEYYVENSKEDYEITSPENVDGFIFTKTGSLIFSLRILLEFKQGTDLTQVDDRARITCQCIHYMYAFKQHKRELPTVIVGADENQAFILLASNFYKYLNRDYKWNVAPSQAYEEDKQLVEDLKKDANLSVYPFQFIGGNEKERYNSLLDLFDSIDSIVQANGKEIYKVTVSPSTIVGMFDEFTNIAFYEPDKIKPVKAVNMFMQMLTGKNDEEYYFLPRHRNLYHLPGDEKVKVYGVQLESYFNHYDRNFTPKEIDQLTSIADRLIKADSRRFKGDFWTPPIWAKRADKIMKDSISDDYKENSLIWDCAAGVRNLTRDFNYNDLYISTYYKDEIYLGEGYNPEAKSAFQYDFLNDDVLLNPKDDPNPKEWKMPDSLFNSLINASKTGKRVIFFTNPPYGTSNNIQKDGSSKKGIAKTKMNKQMIQKGLGKASQQLYCQFIARVIDIVNKFNLKNVYIAFFTNARFFAGGDYFKKFNDFFFSNFEFKKGILLNAGEFSDTASTWPISFAVYKLKHNIDVPKLVNFSVEKSAISKDGSLIVKNIGNHVMRKIYGSDSLKKWATKPLHSLKCPEMKKGTYPQLGSSLKESSGKSPRGKLLVGSLGYMVSNANSIAKGTINNGVYVLSGSAYEANGFNVMPQNFDRACVNFAARRAVNTTWVNAQDNFHYPNKEDNNYEEFVNDSMVFTLFDNASDQAAYRNSKWSNTNVPGKWANQWFWLPINYVKSKVEDNSDLFPIYNDLRGDTDRYVALEIQKRKFSNEAREVLKVASQVWLNTLEKRSLLFDDYPEFYLKAWDAGWFQIKQINKLYPTKSYELFKEKFNKLKNKINNNIYLFKMLVLSE